MRLSMLGFIILVCVSGTLANDVDCLSAFPLAEQSESNTTANNIFYEMAWLPETNCMLLASSAGLQIVDASNVAEQGFIATGDIRNVAVNSMGTQIIYAFSEGTEAYILDAEGEIKEIPVNRLITDLTFLLHEDNLAIATTEIFSVDMPIQSEAQIHIWNAETGGELNIFESDAGWITTLEKMSDNSLLSVGYNNGFPQAVVQTWDLNKMDFVWEYFDIAGELSPSDLFDPFMIQIASTQNGVIAGGGIMGYFNMDNYYGYGIQVWHTSSLDPITEISVFNSNALRNGLRVTDIALSSDAQTIIATSSSDIFVWRVTTGNLISQFTISEGSIQQISLSPDNSLLAVNILIDGRETIDILDFDTLEIIGTVRS